MDKQLHTLSLIETARGIKSRLFTSEEYIRALLTRIESLDEDIQAWAWLKPAEAIRIIMAAEAAFNLEELYLKQASLLSSALRDFLTEGKGVGAVNYLQALKIRLSLQSKLERFLAKYDAIITPPTIGGAPATLEQTGNPCFCSIWSLCGVPAITIPVGFGPRGLPLGLQIVGGNGKDGELLSTAHWCEGLFSFPFWESLNKEVEHEC